MFESSIVDMLAALPLTGNLSTYSGRPSIFSGQAPEDVEFPYLVVFIRTEYPPDDSIITRFTLAVEVLDYSTTEKVAKELIFDVTNGLDNTRFNHDRYRDIRIRKETYFKINVPDPRGIHYRIEFTCRGTRGNWIKTI